LATAVALSAALGTTPAVAGDGAEPPPARKAPAPARPVVLRAGRIAGTVVALDGVTPIAGARVVVRSPKGAVVAEAVADKAGRFNIGPLEAGDYAIETGAAAGKLRLATDVKARDLTVVLAAEVARGVRRAQADEGEEEEEGTVELFGVEMSETTGMLVGIGGVVVGAGGIAVGAAALANHSSSSSSSSPSFVTNPSPTGP
jgi:hypothetical protein